MRISELIKDRETYFVEAGKSVLEAARWMVERNVGALPVLEGGRLVGIFSERDIMKRVVAEGRDPARTRVADVMTAEPLVVSPDDDVQHCMVLMKKHGFRHLPICGHNDKLVGLISLRDMLLHEVSEKDGEVQMMRAYIGAGPIE
jgi:CBS domain-containing protein